MKNIETVYHRVQQADADCCAARVDRLGDVNHVRCGCIVAFASGDKQPTIALPSAHPGLAG